MRDARQIFRHMPRTTAQRAPKGLKDEQQYRAVQTVALLEKGLTPHVERVRATAYVNQDRVLIDCLCDNGVPVLLSARFAACISCGATYSNVEVHRDIRQAAAVLDLRPERNRNWDPRRGETLDDLERENRERGLPVPERTREGEEGGGR